MVGTVPSRDASPFEYRSWCIDDPGTAPAPAVLRLPRRKRRARRASVRYAAPNESLVPVVGPHNGGPRQRTAESALACRVAERPDLGRVKRAKKTLGQPAKGSAGISRAEPFAGWLL